jgi:hypothetical protein
LERHGPHAQRSLEQNQTQRPSSEKTIASATIGPFPGDDVDGNHEHYQNPRKVAMNHFLPCFMVLDGALWKDLVRCGHFVSGIGPSQVTIATGPVRASQSCVRQPYECAENDYAECNHRGGNRHSVQATIRVRLSSFDQFRSL